MLNLAFLFLLQCLSTINIIIIVSVMEWPNELVLDFLTSYEIEAVIWNPALPNHKNRNEVYDAWKRIEEKMEKKFTVTELKKKKRLFNGVLQNLFEKSERHDQKWSWNRRHL